MKTYLGIMDLGWYNFLSNRQSEDVNFWQPSGGTAFKALSPGAPFLFKLKSPINKIGGVGFFSSQTFLPLNMAWEVFEERNGCGSFRELQDMILPYRNDKQDTNPTIGCIVLTNPIFFKPSNWLDVPLDFSKSIVQGKSYDMQESVGEQLWLSIEALLAEYLNDEAKAGEKSQLILEDTKTPFYGKSVLRKVRLGQGAFRVLVTDAYTRRCSISGEKTLPVLEAAHIKPYAQSGPNFISNALLLRSDLHKLFDAGYITVTAEYRVEVSRKIKEEYENGKEYYRFHGNQLVNLPSRAVDLPNRRFIEWHNNFFRE